MVRFHIEELEVFFPYDYVYPEQYEYMRHLKMTLDAKGHCVLEMPTGTGKTVALMSLITSYQLAHSEIGKLIYCTRTVPEMEKALNELQTVVQYQMKQLNVDVASATAASGAMEDTVESSNTVKQQSNPQGAESGATTVTSRTASLHQQESKATHSRRILGIGMASRRNLCIHPNIVAEANRDRVDEKCQALTAPWIRRKRLMATLAGRRATRSGGNSEQNASSTVEVVADNIHASNHQPSRDIEDVAAQQCNQCPASESAPLGMNDQDIVGPAPTSFCQYYENYESLWSPTLLPSGVYTIDDMKRYGAGWKHPNNPLVDSPFCPYFGSRRLLQIANVVVLNYQYILDPKVAQVAFMGGVGPSSSGSGPYDSRYGSKQSAPRAKDPSIVVFDEAHNIDNVCIEAFSVNLNMMTLEQARQNIDKLEKDLNRAKSVNATRLLVEYERLVQNLRDDGQLDDVAVETLASPVLPDDIAKDAIPGTIRRAEFFLATMKRLVLFLTSYIRGFSVKTEGPLTFLKHVKDETTIDPKTLRFCYERLKSLLNTLEVVSLDEYASLTLVADFFTLLGTYWEGFILITDPYPEAEGIYDPLIQLSCLDSSLAMRPVLEKFQSVILTSGTISPLFLYPKLLRFQPVITQSLPMSLDRNCICPLIVSKGSDQVPLSSCFDLRSDNAVLRNFGTLLVELSRTVPDGLVCFFPSYAFMELIVAEWYRMGVLSEVMQHKLILMETKDVVATTLALHSYRRACDTGRGAVFLSVARGKVAEGIDFDRHYGRAVVLFGVPYQYTLSRILKAWLDFMREHYQVPENEFLTFDAMRQLCIARKFLLDMSQPLTMTNKSRLDYPSLLRLQNQYDGPQKTAGIDINNVPSSTISKDINISIPSSSLSATDVEYDKKSDVKENMEHTERSISDTPASTESISSQTTALDNLAHIS